MWALVENDSVVKVFTRPTAITIGENQYPSNIMQVWSNEELEEIGIYEVHSDHSNVKDKAYYINGAESFVFENGQVNHSFAEATPKEIDDVTDEDGNVILGLKSQHKTIINQQAGGLLQPTDWYVIRESEGGTACPDNIASWRTSVRTKSNEMCNLIDDCEDVDSLAALYVYNEEGNRPLGEFPVL